MWRNYLAAALRNLARNRLYSIISILGLAIGICAALLTGLVIRNELGYDRFIPEYAHTYLVLSQLSMPERPPAVIAHTHPGLAGLLRLNFPEITAVTRIVSQEVKFKQKEIEAREKIYWADPNVFEVLALPAAAGDLKTALQRPDGIVLTCSAARKYFGREIPVGETLLLDNSHPMTVTAVLEDLPRQGTHLESGIFVSGLAAFSKLARFGNALPARQDQGFGVEVQTYFQMSSAAPTTHLRQSISMALNRFMPPFPPGMAYSMPIVRIDKVHLFAGLNPGVGERLAALGAVGGLILLIACINFVNLLTARAARRALEVGVRKTAGAGRVELIVQFLGEALLYVLVAVCLAVALAEGVLPAVNAFFETGAVFDYWRDPALAFWIGVGVPVLTVFVGFYPAFVLSAFRPVGALHDRSTFASGGAVRSLLVTLQFAVLTGLIIATAVMHQQRRYALEQALRLDTDQVLLIHGPCQSSFKNELRALQGIRGVGCSNESLLTPMNAATFKLKQGGIVYVTIASVEPDMLRLYGLKPLAGRFTAGSETGTIINQTAVRRFGFASPAAAVGQTLPFSEDVDPRYRLRDGQTIVGVVTDFSLDAKEQIKPTLYRLQPDDRFHDLITVKLAGRKVPETLAAIDGLWRKTGAEAPIRRLFLDEYIQNLYSAVQRQIQTLSVLSAVAVLLACLGLIGLSASMAERRTREIGIRKAMGADRGAVVRLLLWQFTRPVLWANVIAWPAAGWLMHRWLEGFAYHVDLQWRVFLAATLLALAITALTVSAQAVWVAKVRPVEALRYE